MEIPYGSDMDPRKRQWFRETVRKRRPNYAFWGTTVGNLSWFYSAGLYYSYQHPEITIFGLDHGRAKVLLMRLARLVKAGYRFEPGKPYPGAVFGAVERQWFDRYFSGLVAVYNGHDFPILQLIIPDTAGRYPWERGYQVAGTAYQPVLFTPPS
jgi:hypothetical protein